MIELMRETDLDGRMQTVEKMSEPDNKAESNTDVVDKRNTNNEAGAASKLLFCWIPPYNTKHYINIYIFLYERWKQVCMIY